MTATDYMNWRALLKGNYRKGVRAMEQIAQSGELRAAFLGSAEALSVVFSFDPADPDPNALDLYAVAVENDLGAAALGAMLGKGGPATAQDVSASMDSILASREKTNAMAASRDLFATALSGDNEAAAVASGNFRAVVRSTSMDAPRISALAESAVFVSSLAGDPTAVAASEERFDAALATAWDSGFADAPWPVVAGISARAVRNADAFVGYLGKSHPMAVDGYEGLTASICDIGTHKTKDGEPVVTFIVDQLVARDKFSIYPSPSGWRGAGSFNGLEAFTDAIDPDLYALIRNVTITTKDKSGTSTTAARVFPPSATEVGLSGSTLGEVPSVALQRFDKETSRQKRTPDGELGTWLTRSMNGTSVWVVNENGSVASASPTAEFYLAPTFCL